MPCKHNTLKMFTADSLVRVYSSNQSQAVKVFFPINISKGCLLKKSFNITKGITKITNSNTCKRNIYVREKKNHDLWGL